MALLNKELTICSYNSTGFGFAAQNCIETLLLFSDIVCIQEHFLLDCQDRKFSNTDKLKNRFNSAHDMFIVPAKKDLTQVSRGRGAGGLATIWKKSLTKYVNKIDCNNSRLQATRFDFPDSPVLIFNVYFPCDHRSTDNDCSELVELLADLDSLIKSQNQSNTLII